MQTRQIMVFFHATDEAKMYVIDLYFFPQVNKKHAKERSDVDVSRLQMARWAARGLSRLASCDYDERLRGKAAILFARFCRRCTSSISATMAKSYRRYLCFPRSLFFPLPRFSIATVAVMPAKASRQILLRARYWRVIATR